MSYRVVRLDYWEYRFPTGWAFDDRAEALKKAEELDRLECDPLSCYIVEVTERNNV